MLPAAAILILFLAYPLGLGVWLSFTDARIGRSGAFVGLENYEWLWGDAVFWLSVFNTLLYTVVASTIKFAVGLYLALLLNEKSAVQGNLARRRAHSLHRADCAFGDRLLVDLRRAVLDRLMGCSSSGWIDQNIDFLGDAWNARWSVIFANIWRGVPFVAITLLAGCRQFRHRSTRPPPSTGPAPGSGSATSLIRC